MKRTEPKTSKATKAQAKACYDNYFGVLRCLNGGTRTENELNAPRCRAEIAKHVEEAAALAANPSKLLAADAWLMRALTEDIPNNFAAFNRNYPESAAETVAANLHKHGFSFMDASSPRWSDQWSSQAENGFARVAVEEGDEAMHVYRFDPNSCLAWSLDIQYTAVPLAVIDAILAQVVASLKEAA